MTPFAVGVVDVVGRPFYPYITRALHARRHTVEPDHPPQPTTHAQFAQIVGTAANHQRKTGPQVPQGP